ncbi:MAG: DUF502 domain-containing protein [Lentisphaerae bacterium]|nr:DUF502 domain-containing protein [Lentisphaerota bacterium]
MRKDVVKDFRNNFLIGLFLVTPVLLTIVIINALFNFITDSFLPNKWLMSQFGFLYRLMALVLVVVGLYGIGLLVRHYVGHRLYRFGDSVLTRIPVISSIYLPIRQISESIFSSRNTLFKEVVALEFPKPGLYSLGFITSHFPPQFAFAPSGGGTPADMVNVFVPTAPNPTTGFLLFVSRAQLTPVNISVPDAIKLVVSVGSLSSGLASAGERTLLDQIDEWLKKETEATAPEKTDASASPESPELR